MEIPQFLVGSESRFAKFISDLGEEKIALVSHTDLDGISAAKITNEVINADIIKFVDYTDLNQNLIKELNKEKVKKLILTDLSITNLDFMKEAEKHFEILIIDHHKFQINYNSEKTVFMNSQGFCTTYLCYYLFSKIQNLEKLDWLVACASIADWMYFKNQDFMSKTMKKHDDKFEISNTQIKKSGKFWDAQWMLNLALIYHKDNLKKVYNSITENFQVAEELKKVSKEVQEEIDKGLKRFEKEKVSIKEGYFWEFTPKFKIGSIISNILSSKEINKTYIIARQEPPYYNLSARRGDKKVDTSLLLKSLVKGFENSDAGGHIPASGGHIMLKDREKFLENP